MSKIQSVGTSAPVSVLDSPAPSAAPEKAQPELSTPPTPQDPKAKVGGLQLEGQMREAQVRSQYNAAPTFKMPGVDIQGSGVDDPKIQQGFKNFDTPMPPVDMKWPDNASFKDTPDKDGSVRKEFTDADGNKFRESVLKDGTREREMTDKTGNRRFEVTDSTGYLMRGGADTKGNSWSIDNKGATSRMHTDETGMFTEAKNGDGSRTRVMSDKNGTQYTERLDKKGGLEREKSDANGRQFEAKDPSGFWMRGFADNKGNSYSVDSNGTEVRMHHENGTNYGETSFKDGSRTRQISDQQGNVYTERKEINGSITKTHEKLGS